MIKSCRKYWTPEIADLIVQLEDIRFINPQFSLRTCFDRKDFTRILLRDFGVEESKVAAFFEHLRAMNFFDDNPETTGQLFERFFPGRSDVHRLLLEPITYANGSSLDDPAITYGIVFSNFMNRGVFTFRGGTDQLIARMESELRKNGVDLRKCALVEKVVTEGPVGQRRVTGVVARSLNSAGPQPVHTIACDAVLSNAGIVNTVTHLVGSDAFSPEFQQRVQAVRLNTSSCQVYLGIKRGESLPRVGDLVFTSDSEAFSFEELTSLRTQSRTVRFYYPETRPHLREERYAVVASLNARWEDWDRLDERAYEREKDRLCAEALASLDRLIPGVGQVVDHLEAATPRTIRRYTRHLAGASFGTKFEGLQVSLDLPQEVRGLYHAGSVGIIMSGWLGTINYGVITASKLDPFLARLRAEATAVDRGGGLRPSPSAVSLNGLHQG